MAYSPYVVRHKTPNYARSFFLGVCVMPAGYDGLAITTGTCVCTNTYVRNTPKIRRCRYRPLGNHLARVATYGIMKVRRERGEELGEYEKGLRKETEGERKEENGRACKVRRETRCWFNITVFPSLALSPTRLLTITWYLQFDCQ